MQKCMGAKPKSTADAKIDWLQSTISYSAFFIAKTKTKQRHGRYLVFVERIRNKNTPVRSEASYKGFAKQILLRSWCVFMSILRTATKRLTRSEASCKVFAKQILFVYEGGSK